MEYATGCEAFQEYTMQVQQVMRDPVMPGHARSRLGNCRRVQRSFWNAAHRFRGSFPGFKVRK